jgi:NifU-like protein involved in Fe-S cluster formation
LYLIIDQGVVTTAGFVAAGCMVCQAAASILCEAVESKLVQEIESMTSGNMLQLIGIPLTLRRQQCGLLPFVALRQALAISGTPESP